MPELPADESRALAAAVEIVREHGFAEVPGNALHVPIEGAWTDLCEVGEATLWDCLFSDVETPGPPRERWTGSPRPGTAPGSTVDWRERSDADGTLLSREMHLRTAEHESVTLHTDGSGAITKISHWVDWDEREFVRSADGRLVPTCRWCGAPVETPCACEADPASRV
jgi:hypothetical protein